MTKKILLLMILLMFVVSGITLYLIFHFFDPYRNEFVAFISLAITFLLFASSFLSIILYVLKKVYYRGEVFLSHIFSSLRQGALFSLFIIGGVFFHIIGVFSFTTMGLLFVILLFIEMVFQNF